MLGKNLGHYRIVERIGAGGMEEVSRANDQHLERDVALKILPTGFSDQAARKRFRREALALSKLNHPNIATIFDFDTQDGVDFLAMELINGTLLSSQVKVGPVARERNPSSGYPGYWQPRVGRCKYPTWRSLMESPPDPRQYQHRHQVHHDRYDRHHDEHSEVGGGSGVAIFVHGAKHEQARCHGRKC
jgi:hypothetical protein